MTGLNDVATNITFNLKSMMNHHFLKMNILIKALLMILLSTKLVFKECQTH